MNAQDIVMRVVASAAVDNGVAFPPMSIVHALVGGDGGRGAA